MNSSSSSNRTATFQKTSATDAYRNIQALLALHTIEEEAEIMKMAEEIDEKDF